MQRIRDEEKLELAEDRVIDLLRLSKLVDRSANRTRCTG
jgi:hypothetical protein